MSERWAPIPGWEGLYEVSDQGGVKSLARKVPGRPGALLTVRERVLRGSVDEHGYVKIALSRDGKVSTYGLHQLVLLTFVGPCPPGMEACHADDVKSNNTLANLRWGTRSDNTYDRVRNGGHINARKVRCIHGHPFDAENTYITPNGRRQCRTCVIAAKRRHRASRKEAS